MCETEELAWGCNYVNFIVLQLREYLKGGRTTVFQGTSTLHKLVPLPEREC
jgi:hypothetical protein